jgi:hypothetical protein
MVGVRRQAPAAALGDVLAFVRNGGGHVGLYVDEDASAYHVLGGNQSDRVSITRVASLLPFRLGSSAGGQVDPGADCSSASSEANDAHQELDLPLLSLAQRTSQFLICQIQSLH